MKIFRLLSQNIFLVLAIFFIAFVPLYPKLPLLDIKHTWVYIRIEDFLIAFAALLYLVQMFRRKITLETPLTIPIIIFWIVGAIATIHGVFFIFPGLKDVFPQIALLHYLRHIEYVLLFFIGFAAITNKKVITPIIISLAVTMLLVFIYGLGQRYLGFPAFLTMNEEFAKGIPLRLSALSRVPSTFAGHYDLAAYLILMIPLMGSMVFGYKQWWAKVFFVLTAASGLILLMMTASRVSFAVYLVSITVMLILQKKKIFIIPVIIASIILLQGFQGLSQRFASTFTQVDVVVDARTGQAIGIAENYMGGDIILRDEESTGENLPQGSKFINIPQQDSDDIYLKRRLRDASGQMIGSSGNVIVKKAFAYDVSYTTRLQGTWPRAYEALQRNYLLGSGYSSINIASDNNYLRILGEIGVLGFAAFGLIFLFFFIYAAKILPHIDNKLVRSMVFGVMAGVFGLLLNAILIDVFEASKVAFTLWLLLGITVGILHLYEKEKIVFLQEIKRILLSVPALISYLFLLGIIVFAPSFSNYFVADDFTWLRWAADCTVFADGKQCLTFTQSIRDFFVNAHHFFYRPGTKIYFFLMYPVFELFPSTYHFVSYLLHFSATVLVFFIFLRILKNKFYALLGGVLFLTLSVHAEAVYWISVTGHLVAYNCMLVALLVFMFWQKNKHPLLLATMLLSMFTATLFYESAIVAPILLIGYDLITGGKVNRDVLMRRWYYPLFLLIIPLYYLIRTLAKSFWMQGDYQYSIPDIPFNIAGNLFGYAQIILLGTDSLPFYYTLRSAATQNLVLTFVCLLIVLGGFLFLCMKIKKHVKPADLRALLFAALLFITPLIPFLGLGNISPRYAYLSAVGVVFLLVYLLQKAVMATGKKQHIAATVFVAFLVIVYASANISVLHRVNAEWKAGGEISNTLLTNLNLSYGGNIRVPRTATFYFVNVPMKYENAWVFPWGLPDAVWFATRKPYITVKQTNSLEEALKARDASRYVTVFEFLPDGSIALVNRNPNQQKSNEK